MKWLADAELWGSMFLVATRQPTVTVSDICLVGLGAAALGAAFGAAGALGAALGAAGAFAAGFGAGAVVGAGAVAVGVQAATTAAALAPKP